jgi:hypothetical protein
VMEPIPLVMRLVTIPVFVYPRLIDAVSIVPIPLVIKLVTIPVLTYPKSIEAVAIVPTPVTSRLLSVAWSKLISSAYKSPVTLTSP